MRHALWGALAATLFFATPARACILSLPPDWPPGQQYVITVDSLVIPSGESLVVDPGVTLVVSSLILWPPPPPPPTPEELARTHGWIAPAVHDEAPASEEARRLALDVAIARLRASHPARARRGRHRCARS
jgi:hypothetical protein